MTLQVLTPIYPPEIKPVRDGAYLVVWWDSGDGRYELEMAQWGGHRWFSADGSLMTQHQRWVGLAFDPAAAEERFSAMRITDDGPVSLGVFLPGASCC